MWIKETQQLARSCGLTRLTPRFTVARWAGADTRQSFAAVTGRSWIRALSESWSNDCEHRDEQCDLHDVLPGTVK
jgi:hypothetical protein